MELDESKFVKPTPSQRPLVATRARSGGRQAAAFRRVRPQVSERTVKSCIDKGWAEPWFANPLKPAWLVCKLTKAGRTAAIED